MGHSKGLRWAAVGTAAAVAIGVLAVAPRSEATDPAADRYIVQNAPLSSRDGIDIRYLFEDANMFTATLSSTKVAVLRTLGATVTPVAIRTVDAPGKGNGTQGGGKPTTTVKPTTTTTAKPVTTTTAKPTTTTTAKPITTTTAKPTTTTTAKPTTTTTAKPTTTTTVKPTTTIKPTTTTVKAPQDPVPWGVERVILGSANGNNSVGAEHATAGTGIKVAVIDTGIDANHPDLVGKVQLDSAGCYNFVPATPGPGCADDNGHGTHVAGIIAAGNKAADGGIYGVAPGVTLLAYKACDSAGKCASDDVAAAIKTAVNAGANIINLSLGSAAASVDELAALDAAAVKGVLVVAAAGNGGTKTCAAVLYPAASVRAVSVASTDSGNGVVSTSCRGNNLASGHTLGVREEGEVEVAAPGGVVLSTWLGGTYKSMTGTSMATPHISGLAARLWASLGSAANVRNWLVTGADDITNGSQSGGGEDNASGIGLPDIP